MGLHRIDWLIIEEMSGPWLFGVAMFTTLIVASTFLNKITDYIVHGISGMMVAELTLLLLPSVIVKTFPMAMLLAGLLGFGRLSSDSEVIALRAAGTSVLRIMLPVAGMSFAVALLAFLVNEAVVPEATMKSVELQNEAARTIDIKFMQPISQPIVEDGQLVGMVVAQDFNLKTGTLSGATIISYGKNGAPTFYLFARELDAKLGGLKKGGGWHIRGGGQLVSADAQFKLDIKDEAWPSEIPKLNTSPEELLTVTTAVGFDSYDMKDFKEYIDTKRMDKNVLPSVIRNLEFAYWNKIALPLGAIVFGLLGAPLGIRNIRAGAATGFALSIGIIFAYLELSNFMNVWAMGGLIPPYLASFTPLAIGLACSGVIMWRRNK